MQMMILSSPAGSLKSDTVTSLSPNFHSGKTSSLLSSCYLVFSSWTDNIMELHSLGSSLYDFCSISHMGQCVDEAVLRFVLWDGEREQCREINSFSHLLYLQEEMSLYCTINSSHAAQKMSFSQWTGTSTLIISACISWLSTRFQLAHWNIDSGLLFFSFYILITALLAALRLELNANLLTTR